MNRRIKERESRSLAGSRQRGALRKTLPALDIRRRQRSQSARHFWKRQVREVTFFEPGDPVLERAGDGGRVYLFGYLDCFQEVGSSVSTGGLTDDDRSKASRL